MNFLERILQQLKQTPNRPVIQEVREGQFVTATGAELLFQIGLQADGGARGAGRLVLAGPRLDERDVDRVGRGEPHAGDRVRELALFNLGMLSIQSGQNEKAVSWLSRLVEVNPAHTQGTLLLGLAYMNTGEKKKAKEQFEKVKDMDKDPAVQAAVDSYLKDLNK